MSCFAHVLALIGVALSRPTRRAILQLETLDNRIVPSGIGLSSGITSSSGGLASTLTSPPVLANPYIYPSIVYPTANSLLNKTLNLIGNDGVNYGHVSFSQATANSDGTTTLQGQFVSGTLMIPVTGTLGFYHLGGSLGFGANFSFTGAVLNPMNPNAGEVVTFTGSLSQNYQHATVTGQLQVCVSNDLIDCLTNQPYTPVSGNWF